MSGNESPVAAVKADAAVVSQPEIGIRGHDDVLPLKMGRQLHSPRIGDIGIVGRRHRREIIPVRVAAVVRVMKDIRLFEPFAITIDYALT